MVYAGGFTSAAVAITPVTVAFFPVIFQQIKLLISCLKTLTKTILISRHNLLLLFCCPSFVHFLLFFYTFSPSLRIFLFCCSLLLLFIHIINFFFSLLHFSFYSGHVDRAGCHYHFFFLSVVYGKLSAPSSFLSFILSFHYTFLLLLIKAASISIAFGCNFSYTQL